jgi:hypothetical protein
MRSSRAIPLTIALLTLGAPAWGQDQLVRKASPVAAGEAILFRVPVSVDKIKLPAGKKLVVVCSVSDRTANRVSLAGEATVPLKDAAFSGTLTVPVSQTVQDRDISEAQRYRCDLGATDGSRYWYFDPAMPEWWQKPKPGTSYTGSTTGAIEP